MLYKKIYNLSIKRIKKVDHIDKVENKEHNTGVVALFGFLLTDFFLNAGVVITVTRQRLMFVSIICMLLFIGIMLFINVQAQTPKLAKIAFVSYRNGNAEIYVMDSDGKNQRNLTNSPGEDVGPDWFDPAFAYAVSFAGKFMKTWGWIKHNGE